MDYKKKIEYAERIAKELQGQKSVDDLKSELKAEGLYDRDITSIMVSARKVLGESYQPKIRAYLMADKQIQGAEEFNALDAELLGTLISQERNSIAMEEKKKIGKLVKEGHSADQVLEQIDTRFLPAEQAAEQIATHQQVKKQNSGSGRMFNIAGGIGLILLTGILLVTIGRLFYVLPFIGIVMIVKGFITAKAD